MMMNDVYTVDDASLKPTALTNPVTSAPVTTTTNSTTTWFSATYAGTRPAAAPVPQETLDRTRPPTATGSAMPAPSPYNTNPNAVPFPPTIPNTGSVNPRAATDAVSMVQSFADVLYAYSDTALYTEKAIACAAYIKRPVLTTADTLAGVLNNFFSAFGSTLVSAIPTVFRSSYPYVTAQQPIASTSNLQQSNVGVRARVTVIQFADEVAAFSSRAKAAGLDPPDDPFAELAVLQATRRSGTGPIQLSYKLASDVLFNIQAYVDLIQAQKAGAIDFDKATFNTAQLEHLSLAYSGLGGTGNVAADLMKLLPNADAIKAKRAQEALSVLNFSKRQPWIVFTAEYSPNQRDGAFGTMIGWKRINDAAGYILKRHAVMSNTDIDIEISNDQIADNNSIFMNYAKAYVLTFYDRIKPDNMCLYVDTTAEPDEYYVYRIQAYQVKKDDGIGIIPSDFVTLNLSGQQKININNRVRELDPVSVSNSGQETISPWPVFAEQILGDASLDWILAAANVRAAIDRGETKSVSRSYSYLNAHTTWLLSQADQGKLVRPASIDVVRQAVANSIRTYGVMQTIESLLQETGILYYFDARDARWDTTFDRAGTLDNSTSSIIGVVAAAIDPENATINLKTLSTNLFQVLTDGKLEDYTTSLTGGVSEGSNPTEIRIDPDTTTDTTAETNVQYAAFLSELSDTTVDLTTFDGIAKFIRAIRTMSDFGPNRVPPTTKPVVITLSNPKLNPI